MAAVVAAERRRAKAATAKAEALADKSEAVLAAVAAGVSVPAIAEALGGAPRTVSKMVERLRATAEG